MTVRWFRCALVLSVALVLGACTGEVAANSVEVGTCTTIESDDLFVGSIDAVDCNESHAEEVFALFDLPGDDFPGEAGVNDDAFEGCIGSRFESYVGVPFESSEVFVTFLAPTRESWDRADDRTVICLAFQGDGSLRTGSVRDLGR